jgi:glutaredoxin 3
MYNCSTMTIKIYSTPTCTYCHLAKEFFAENKLAFEEIDVAADVAKRREMIEKSGQMGVPVIEINDQVIVGFDKSLIERKIKEASAK